MVIHKAKSKLDSVIVYSDRVMVTRLIDVSLKGSTDIVIPDLPGALDDQSVRTRAKDLQIGEVQVKTGYREEKRPRVKIIDNKIKKLMIEDRARSDEIVVLQDMQKFLGTISVSGPEVISKELWTGKIAPQAWHRGLKFVGGELLKAKMRIVEIERERREIKKKIDALKQELSDIKSIMQNRKTVIFDAHPKGAKKYRIELSYIIYGASWRTYYELRAYLPTGKVKLSYFGKISQRTGEDWDNTKISLSTAQPVRGGAAPEPGPWYIDLYMPRPEKKARMAASKAAPEPLAKDMELREEYEAAAPPVETGIAITYPLPGLHTIKSGVPEKKVKICDKVMAADFEYFIMPRIGEIAYSTGKFKNTTDYLFLAGDSNTYVGDDFTGQTYLEAIAPDEKATVSFGVDDRVKIERKTKKYKVSKGGLVKKTTKYEFTYENTIKNFHNKEIKCKIVDQVPVTQSPDIKISDIRITPKPTKDEKERRIYYWKVGIGAGKEYKITVSFSVEAPYDAQVEGLMI
jgi:uncharacterized protein (TIGR02231 family)